MRLSWLVNFDKDQFFETWTAAPASSHHLRQSRNFTQSLVTYTLSNHAFSPTTLIDMKSHIRIIYMLVALIASQSVWAMLDEHGISGDTAASEQLRHDGHSADVSDKEQHSDDAESCVHCCHCHFHQTTFLPPSNALVEQTGRGTKAMNYFAWLTEAHQTTPFRPPIH